MKGILLVSHGAMCQGVKESCAMIVGERDYIDTLSLTDEGVEVFRQSLETKITEMNEKYDEIIIISDIPMVTPYNECARYIFSHDSQNIRLIGGMNLAMIIDLAIFSEGDMPLDDLVAQVMNTAKESIKQLQR